MVIAGAERTGFAPTVARLLSEVANDPEMHKLFTENLVEPRRRVVATLIERAKARGEIREDIDTSLAVDLIVGPAIYRLLLSGGDLSEVGNPADILTNVLEGLRPR